jgi:hypothetical protein
MMIVCVVSRALGMTFRTGESCMEVADCEEVALECTESNEVSVLCIDDDREDDEDEEGDEEKVCQWFCSAPNWRLCFRGAVQRNKMAHFNGLNYGNRQYDFDPLGGAVEPDINSVTCPFLASLVENGDLTTNAFDERLGQFGGEEDGADGQCAFASALASTGARSESLVANAFMDNLPPVVHGVDIFDLVGAASEHSFDTGTRSPPGLTDNLRRIENLRQLTAFGTNKKRNGEDKDKDNKLPMSSSTLSYDEFGKALEHFDEEGNDPRPGSSDLLGRVFGLILTIFGRGKDCPTK